MPELKCRLCGIFLETGLAKANTKAFALSGISLWVKATLKEKADAEVIERLLPSDCTSNRSDVDRGVTHCMDMHANVMEETNMILILECIIICFILLVPCVVTIANGIHNAAFLFEQDVRDRVVEMGLATREQLDRNRKIFKFSTLLVMVVFVLWAVYGINGARGFWTPFWQIYTLAIIYTKENADREVAAYIKKAARSHLNGSSFFPWECGSESSRTLMSRFRECDV